MNYLDESIRGIKFQKGKIPNSKKEYAASSGELNLKRLNILIKAINYEFFQKVE